MLDATNTLKDLQTMREEGYLSDPIIRKAVRQIEEADERFDWVGVYLLDTENNELWLHNYRGESTEHAKIPVGQGVCGAAVESGENQNVPDVHAIENYIACTPDVQSELVVLIRAGDEILGQIDIDSNRPAAFTDEDEATVVIIADKLAEVLMADRR
ncbi:MAG: GAF domain-containing protein [Gemmatimonadota bacterium]